MRELIFHLLYTLTSARARLKEIRFQIPISDRNLKPKLTADSEVLKKLELERFLVTHF